MNPFLSFGIELEGGIYRKDIDADIRAYLFELFGYELFRKRSRYTDEQRQKIDDRIALHFQKKTDGSVGVASLGSSVGWIGNIEMCFWHKDFKVLVDFVRFVFEETSFRQNRSCGNHIHIKFKDMGRATAVFSYKKIWDCFKKLYLETFCVSGDAVKYEGRLGKHYCKHIYSERNTIGILNDDTIDVDRYRSINLLSLKYHKTIEFRILPHFDTGKEAVSSIRKLVNILKTCYARDYKCSKKGEFSDSQDTIGRDYSIGRDALVLDYGIEKEKIGGGSNV